MGKQHHSSPREVVDQASVVVSSGQYNDLNSPAASGRDVLLLHDLPEDLTYRAIHDLVKQYGDIARIRLTYDRDCPSNRCYVVFATAPEARLALQSVGSFNILCLHADTLSSRNMTESDLDYVPNILERTAEMASSEVRQAPTARCFAAYYRNGQANFIHATRYLHAKVGNIPRENIKKSTVRGY